MNTRSVLVIALVISVSFNVYFWLALRDVNISNTASESTSSSSQTEVVSEYGPNDVATPTVQNSTPTEIPQSTNDPLINNATDSEGQYSQDELENLLNEGLYGELTEKLSVLLKQYPNDENLLLIEAELQLRTRPLPDALVHLYDLLELSLSYDVHQSLVTQINTRYEQAEREFIRSGNWDLLAQLCEPLFQRLPTHRSYILSLARAYAMQEKLILMEDVLAALPLDDYEAMRIRNKAYTDNSEEVAATDNYQSTETAPFFDDSEATIIDLERRGNQYRIDVKMLNNSAQMILDTGASTTAITQDMFAHLGRFRRLTFIGNFDVQTASGSINAPMVQIPAFYLGPYQFEGVSALVLPKQALPNADGLLGMNILGQFDFSIRPEESTLVLRER